MRKAKPVLTYQMIRNRLEWDAELQRFRWRQFDWKGVVRRGRPRVGEIAGAAATGQIRLGGHKWSHAEILSVYETGKPLVRRPRPKLIRYAGYCEGERGWTI